jgi:TonB-linked SusC/RagA family outer membrane protein
MNKKLPQKRFPSFSRMFLLGLAFLGSLQVYSQDIMIKGRVLSEEGESIPGANVSVKNSNLGTVTDIEGNYQIQVPDENQVLVFSFIGYVTQEIPVNGRSQIDVTMESDIQALQEVVIIGYGSVQKSDLTGSVGRVEIEDLVKAPVASFADALAGRVAGVRVSGSDGQPGGGMNIVIRGAGSLTQSTSPLYVIDGFPVEDLDPATLNPEDIESMTILKDASSTAVYGSRAANGVILIQTKRGIVGEPVVSLSSSYGIQQNPRKMEMMDPYEFVKYQSELNPTSFETPAYFANDRTLDYYRNVEGIDWQDEVIQTGAVQIHNLSVRGGTENTRYAISGSMYDQKGVIVNTGLSRYTGRVTLDQTISDKVKVGITSNYSGVNTFGQVLNQGAGSSSPSSYVLFRTWAYRPVTPDGSDLLNALVDENAVNNSDFRVNPFIDLENQHQENSNNLVEANGYVSYEITKDLLFKSNAGIRHESIRWDRFYNSRTSQGSPFNPNNANGINGMVRYIDNRGFSNENTLNYTNTINDDHTITGLGLFAINSYSNKANGFSSRQLPNENLGMDGLDEGLPYDPIASSSVNTMVSYATRWDYNYKSKYIITGTFRADGSSKFVDHWGYFPGGAIAWNMDREDFFTNAFPFISTSKLRASYGTIGNNRVGDFDTHPRLNQTLDGYSFNNETPTGSVYISAVGNPSLRWEKVTTIDMGYEFGLFGDRITMEVDVYRKLTEDLLLNAPLPPTTGFGSAVKNIGKLRNDGLEISLNSVNVSSSSPSGFYWDSQFNISFNNNKIMELTRGQQSLQSVASFESQFNSPLYMSEIGKSAGMMIGYIWEGNYQYEDFENPAPDVYILKNSVPTNGALRNAIQPGDIKYRDLNGDGVVNVYDKTIIGRGQPIHIGGFANNLAYKGFNLHLFLQWSYGNDIYNANRLSLEGNSNGRANMNQFASYANRWSPENPTNENYRTRGQGPIGVHSSRVVEDGSFLRLKTVSFSYALPAQQLEALRFFNHLSFNVTSQNLLTWTNYSGMDPEVSTRNPVLTPGFDFSSYPQARTLVFGIKAEF